MDKSKLIDKHLTGNHAIIHGNVHHFVVTGEVKGAFKQMLIEMLQEFEQDVRGQKPKSENGKLPIPHVSQQRELLIDFCEVYATGQFEDPDNIESIVDWYLRVKDN